MLGEHTILCALTDIHKNTPIEAQVIQLILAQLQAAHHIRIHGYLTTITAQWDCQTFVDNSSAMQKNDFQMFLQQKIESNGRIR